MKVLGIENKSTNCYLIAYESGWIMIDTGLPDTFPQLLRILSQNDIPITEIDYLIITHFHPDHAGLTQHLKDLGTNLILHETQVPYIGKINSFFKKNPKANFKDITSSNCIIVSGEESRNLLKDLGIDGELVHTPGHSDDSISLVIDHNCAFTGDLPALNLQEAYGDPVISESWNQLKSYHLKTIYPSHGPAYTME